MATRSEVWRQAQAEQKRRRDPNIGRVRSRVVAGESKIAGRYKHWQSEYKRATRYINRGKKTKPARRLIVGTIAGARFVAGTTRATGKTLKVAGKGTWVAGKGGWKVARGTGRIAVGSVDRAATSNLAHELNRRAVRGYARSRIVRRRVAGRMYHRAEQHSTTKPRMARLEEMASRALATRQRGRSMGICAGCGNSFRTAALAARHHCGPAERAEEAAIRKATTKVAGIEKTPKSAGASTSAPTGGGTTAMATRSTAPNHKGKLGFVGWRPETASDFIDTLAAMGKQFSTEATGLGETNEYCDVERHLDAKVVAKMEALQKLLDLASDGCKDVAKTFEKLYADEMKDSKPKARAVTNSDEFFEKTSS